MRAQEARKLKAAGGEPVLTHTRWCLLKRPENLTDTQENRLQELLRHNLRTVRAYLLKEDFQLLWSYYSPGWAGRFLDAWCRRESPAGPSSLSDLEPCSDPTRPPEASGVRAGSGP